MTISKFNRKFLFSNEELIEKVKEIVSQYDDPLTLRQIYYRLVSIGLPNSIQNYKTLSSKLARAREDGLLPWSCMVDNIRHSSKPSSWHNPNDFFNTVKEAYRRSLMDGQFYNMEVWCEKNVAVADVSDKYDIPLYAGGGYRSASSKWEASERLGYKPSIIFYLGDFDPSGLDIERDLEKSLRTFGVDVKVVRVLLTWNDIQEYQLLPAPVKLKDSRANGYVQKYGTNVYELDALPPNVLKTKLESAIKTYLDEDIYQAQLKREKTDKIEIDKFLSGWNGGKNDN